MIPPEPIARWFANHPRAATAASWVVVVGFLPVAWVQARREDKRSAA